jgi:hypothetical protein
MSSGSLNCSPSPNCLQTHYRRRALELHFNRGRRPRQNKHNYPTVQGLPSTLTDRQEISIHGIRRRFHGSLSRASSVHYPAMPYSAIYISTRGRSSSHGRGRIFLLSASSRPALGPTQPPIQWVTKVKLSLCFN